MPQPNNLPTDELVHQIETELSSLFRMARIHWKNAACEVHPELQPIGYKILSVMIKNNITSAATLGETLLADKSVISRQIKTLKELELITCELSSSDRRARILRPTEQAIVKVNQAQSNFRARFHKVLSNWPLKDLENFSSLLSSFTDEITKP